MSMGDTPYLCPMRTEASGMGVMVSFHAVAKALLEHEKYKTPKMYYMCG